MDIFPQNQLLKKQQQRNNLVDLRNTPSRTLLTLNSYVLWGGIATLKSYSFQTKLYTYESVLHLASLGT